VSREESIYEGLGLSVNAGTPADEKSGEQEKSTEHTTQYAQEVEPFD
jgi:hypothetical protein